jgi:hypothetical protein
VDPQVFVSEKLAAPVPLSEIALKFSVAVPLLVIVTDCGLLLVPIAVDVRLSAVDESVTAGAAATPVPDSAIDTGLPAALVASAMDAEDVPAPVGV